MAVFCFLSDFGVLEFLFRHDIPFLPKGVGLVIKGFVWVETEGGKQNHCMEVWSNGHPNLSMRVWLLFLVKSNTKDQVRGQAKKSI